MSLTCPKCSSEMKSYERNRVLVDQCTGCGGLFLDKGELEQLAAAENAWHAAQAAPPVQQAGYSNQASYSNTDDRPRYDSHDSRRDGGYSKPRKKKSFLSEMFDD